MTVAIQFDPLEDHQVVGFSTETDAINSARTVLPAGTPFLVSTRADRLLWSWTYSAGYHQFVPGVAVKAVIA